MSPPLPAVGHDPASQKTAEVANAFLTQARKILASQAKANFHTMRGFACKPALPSYQDVYGLKAAAIAVYPMYKGLARLVGMDIVGSATNLQQQVETLQQVWKDYDFFFLHFNTPIAPVRMVTSRRRCDESKSWIRCYRRFVNSSQMCSS